jgi:hypothetical protein
MQQRLIVRGVLAGAIAGLLAFVFARIFAEPQIQQAIDYESGREAAQAALDRAAGLTVETGGGEVFSRAVQGNVGVGVGIIAFGVAVGAMFAICLGRVGNLRPRTLAVLVAGGGFLGLYLVPFVKYPANPPAVGHGETIQQRGSLYLLMVATSVVFLGLSVWAGKRLALRFGNWNASLLAGAGFLVAMGVVMAVLPPFGHVGDNLTLYGNHSTETPLPLTGPDGRIAYPGFPADVLFSFRLYSVAAQVILWTAIGLVFAPLAERLLAPPRAASTEPAAVS